ncbi:3'-5' exonuclease [Endozoicomonas ascidiicola]|uniref:3'-5' exonuclease n=1 Tax=Endozoicomonas ascidiicola TaxID=1698521 RepID=UPI00082C3C2A|nr:3'-5' exonuclease [Endozoicomonas ascidiicola]
MISKKTKSALYQKWMSEFTAQKGSKSTYTRPALQPARSVSSEVPAYKVSSPYQPFSIPDSFIVLDLETTGFSHYKNNIIEVAAIKVRNFRATTRISHLVRLPKKETIPPIVQEITGITERMLASKGIDIKDAIESVRTFIGDETLIIHNAPFDTRFLKVHMPLNNKVICSLSLSRRAFPDIGSHKLSYLKDCFGSDVEESHRALADCYAVIDVVRACKKALST